MKNQIKREILKELKTLASAYPNQTLCLHIGIALADYANIEDITDKEFLFALQKYSAEKELNTSIPHKEDIDKIIQDAMNLDKLYEDEDYSEDEY